MVLTDLITKRVTKNGRLLDVLLSVFPLKDETGRIIGSCGIARDITEQLAAEEELKKQNSILKEAEELAQMGSWEYNIHTKGFIWCEGMYELFNLEKNTPVTPSIYLELAKEDDQDIAQKIVSDIENSTGPFEQALHIKSNGKIKIFKIKATVIR